MPYPNEHSCRINEPIKGAQMRRANGEREHNGKKYDVIYQKNKDKWEDQAYRYPKETWDANEARSHCKSHDGSFEAAGESEGKTSFFKIQNKADEIAEILLYGDIGESFFSEGIGAKELAKEIKALGNIKQLDVRINSAGGSVFEGIAIYNIIERAKANKNVYIDGLAASIASVVAMVGDKVIMAENSMMMIHNPFGQVIGDATDMRKMAENLDMIKGQMITTYQHKTNLPFQELSDMMQQETWMNANEALAKGFATEVSKPIQVDASIKYNFSNYKRVPSILQGQPPCDGPEAKDREAEALLNEINETHKKTFGGK